MGSLKSSAMRMLVMQYQSAVIHSSAEGNSFLCNNTNAVEAFAIRINFKILVYVQTTRSKDKLTGCPTHDSRNCKQEDSVQSGVPKNLSRIMKEHPLDTS